jgi:hypothetical protein
MFKDFKILVLVGVVMWGQAVGFGEGSCFYLEELEYGGNVVGLFLGFFHE